MKVLTTLLLVAIPVAILLLVMEYLPKKTPLPPPAPAAPVISDFQIFAPYLAILEGDKSAGSGFIAAYQGSQYLFTNTHVLGGNTRLAARLLDGTPIVTTGLSVADDYDVAAFPQTTVKKGGIEILDNVEKNVSLGDDVVVLGNSLGAAVVTKITGKVTGIGPELIEVDAKFVAGNSGSPIIHLKTGKAIGIATFSMIRKMDKFGKDSQFNSVERRFGYRLDNIGKWRNTTWQAFSREAATIAVVTKRTEDIWNLAADLSHNNRIQDWARHTQQENALAGVLTEYHRTLETPSVSKSEVTEAGRKLLFWINREIKKDFPNPAHANFSAFNKKVLKEQKEYRDMLAQFFDQVEDGLR